MAKQYTKEAIKAEFLRQLNAKPLNQITVKSIVENCSINRNTFYYYYEDIYDLLKDVFTSELEKSYQELDKNLSWEEYFIHFANFILSNPRSVEHIYYSMQRADLERHTYEAAGEAMRIFVSRLNENIHANETDVALIANFYQCALTQYVIKWIESGMKDDPDIVIRRLGFLLKGNIESSLKRSLEK